MFIVREPVPAISTKIITGCNLVGVCIHPRLKKVLKIRDYRSLATKVDSAEYFFLVQKLNRKSWKKGWIGTRTVRSHSMSRKEGLYVWLCNIPRTVYFDTFITNFLKCVFFCGCILSRYNFCFCIRLKINCQHIKFFFLISSLPSSL